jgi:hypothetical protein
MRCPARRRGRPLAAARSRRRRAKRAALDSTLGRETIPKHNSSGLIYVPEPAQRAVLDKARRLGDDLIFRTKRGQQFRQESLHRVWAPVRDAFTAKLPDAHHLRERLAVDPEDRLDFYELRHFGASYMLNVLELEPWVIAEQLRHSDGGALVLELYGHPDRREAIRRIRRAYTADAVRGARGIRGAEARPRRGKLGERERVRGAVAGHSCDSNLPPPLSALGRDSEPGWPSIASWVR